MSAMKQQPPVTPSAAPATARTGGDRPPNGTTKRRQGVSRTELGARRDGRRRKLNLAVAAIGLLVALPAIVLIALAVKCTSPGAVIYTQARVGHDRRRRTQVPPDGCRRGPDRGGRIFAIYKFRTMRRDATQAEVWAQPDDVRITRIGAVLRKHRLDELPQFFNVLKGDMNVVGPRPEQPTIFENLKGEVPGYSKRQRVLPGITGWAQINHRYDQCVDDVRRKTELDLAYMRRRCAVEDLRIMAKTLPVMIQKTTMTWSDRV